MAQTGGERGAKMPELIDKSKLIADIWDDLAQLKGAHCTAEDAAKYLDDLVRKQPTIEAKPVRHGRWIDGYCECEKMNCVYCSECGHAAYWDTDYGQQRFKFCQNCGAKMDGGAENDT